MKQFLIISAGYTPTKTYPTREAARAEMKAMRDDDKARLKSRGWTEVKMGKDSYRIMIGNKHSTALFSSYTIIENK